MLLTSGSETEREAGRERDREGGRKGERQRGREGERQGGRQAGKVWREREGEKKTMEEEGVGAGRRSTKGGRRRVIFSHSIIQLFMSSMELSSNEQQ